MKNVAGAAALRYCGPAQRTEYCNHLRACGIPEDIAESAMRSVLPENCFGAGRNVLMLDHAGEVFLCADDDTVARSVVHPFPRKGIRLVGKDQCFDYWFFRSRQSAFEWARWKTVDVIGEHAALIRTVASLVGSGAEPIQLDRICGHFADGGWDPRIIATMAGKIGDSGRYDPEWDVWIGNWAAGRESLGRLEVAEVTDSIVIGHEIDYMTTMGALDLRSILPPFFFQSGPARTGSSLPLLIA